MKKTILYWMLSLVLIVNVTAQNDTLLRLWYLSPARQWVEALPVGNGRLGAMVFGDPCKEVIQLNENSVWAGQPNRNDNPDAKEALPEVRKYLYKIAVVDTCGNLSELSSYHKPMFLQLVGSTGGVNLQWSNYEVEGGDINFTKLEIYRGKIVIE